MANQRPLDNPPPFKKQRIDRDNFKGITNSTQQNNVDHDYHHKPSNQKQENQANQTTTLVQHFHPFLNMKYVDPMIPFIYKWMHGQCTSPNIEIEAKIGKLKPRTYRNHNNNNDHNRFDRIHQKLGLLSTSIIDANIAKSYFLPGVEDDIFKFLISNILNKWFKNCNQIKPHQRILALRDIELPKIKYFEKKTMDQYYAGERTRTTFDLSSKTNNMKTIIKKKISDLNISFPHLPYDLRISASIEQNAGSIPLNRKISLIRFKHRRSYKFDYFSVDITEIYQYEKNLTNDFIQFCQQKFINKSSHLDVIEMPLDIKFGAKRAFEVELEIDADCLYQFKHNNNAHFSNLIKNFVQDSINLVNLTSRNTVPNACKLPR